MKCHTTKKQTWIFGILFVFTAVVFSAVGARLVNAEGKTQTQEVDVKFTFNSVLNLTIDKQGVVITDLMPGNAKESDTAKLTIETNSPSGYYLSATVGQKDGKTDLTGASGKFTMMATNANIANISDAAASTWGFAYAKGESGDLSKSAFNGLGLDAGDNGATGTKLIDAASNDADKVVKFKVGAKAGPTTPAGTYSNQLNFYAVTK